MHRIIFTGGGTAGHVTPNIALIRKMRALGWETYYIGSYHGIERQLIEEEDVPYYSISVGKLRRYFDVKNFTDPFRVIRGTFQAAALIRKIRPQVVFSKGGFVSLPVVVGARLNGIPAILHESDMTPGLANRIMAPFATKICVTFPETLQHLPRHKAVHTGSPIRPELFTGDKDTGMKLCGFLSAKPVLLVMGGSSGAVAINNAVRKVLTTLLEKYQVIHLCGYGNLDPNLAGAAGYCQFEYVTKELPHLLAAADLVVSRAGANSLCELLALKKPALLIPLPRHASRGDQILNARSFNRQGFSRVLLEEHMTENSLLEAVEDVYQSREQLIQRMQSVEQTNGTKAVLRVILDTL